MDSTVISAVGAASASSSYQLPSVGKGQQLGSDDFLKLLVAQMQNQDPLEPTSNEQFITQMAQMTSFEQMSELNDQFKVNAGLQMLTTGTSMIGKQVTYTDPETSTETAGVVSKVEMENGAFTLLIGSKRVPLANVKVIETPPAAE